MYIKLTSMDQKHRTISPNIRIRTLTRQAIGIRRCWTCKALIQGYSVIQDEDDDDKTQHSLQVTLMHSSSPRLRLPINMPVSFELSTIFAINPQASQFHLAPQLS